MSVLEDILTWSNSAPLWMKDALRRIVIQREIIDSDITALTEFCKKPHGLSSIGETAESICIEHLPTAVSSGPVTLQSVTHISDVNALAPGETINLSGRGLTIVYGDNGAGKTGYTRILKRACRARGSAEPVLANALSDQAAGTPTAMIKLEFSGTQVEHTWKDGAVSVPELSAIGVFDSSAAQVYVSDRTEVKFRPFGLDVLDKLATICAKVKIRLEQERQTLESQIASLPVVPENTEVAKLLDDLSALTSVEKINRLANLSEQEQQDLKMLEEVLAAAKADEPQKRSADLKLKAARISGLSQELKAISQELSPEAIQHLMNLRTEAALAEQKACELTSTFDKVMRLTGFGTPAWRQLWEAAGEYSQSLAYPHQGFPFVGQGSVCVLCQQDLADEAKDRFQKFITFAQNQIQLDAREKATVLEEKINKLKKLDVANVRRDARDDLAAQDSTLSAKVEAFLDAVKICLGSILRADKDLREPGPSCPESELRSLATELSLRADELTKAIDPSKRLEMEQRYSDLAARRILMKTSAIVFGEVKRKARINAYSACLKDADTRALTRLSTDLTKKYVTDILTSAFTDELKKLSFTVPELELRAVGGQKGLLYHQIQLKYATKADLPKVVSEGEARCIALAAFLAELRSAGHNSGIVFDDPVSSLDHKWRTRVAVRLADLAKERQVIVFTHELVFLQALIHASESVGVEFSTQSVWRHASTCGHVESDLPWAALSTQRRIGWLRNEWQRAEKVYRAQGEREYQPIAINMYARLRQTWERAVEEILLCGVVERFRHSVETQRLRRLDVLSSDLEIVEAGMTKSSRWEGGHDHALAVNEPPPKPDELQTDISSLESWIKTIEMRRKKKT